MIYRFWNKLFPDPIVKEFDSRLEATKWVENNMASIQKFAVYESGHIFGYAVELSDETEKPVAILYPHKIAQLIWIDMD